ncbi:MAG TPA: PLP-dependent aminotransferase family protein, partial [Steroidobacteraceae bacterium]
ASLGMELIACAGDSQGMLPESLDTAAREHGAAAVYLMPTVHNPLGTVMPENRRRKLCEIAERHDLLIIDDDAYRFTEANPPPSFAALAPTRSFSIWSFTKPYAPVLKLSYLSFPQPYQKQLIDAIRITSTGASALFAALGSGMIRSGALPKLIAAKRLDAARRQALAGEILGKFAIQRHPTSYHIWIHLPADRSAATLAADLLAQGVRTSPCEDFATTPHVKANGLRVALGATSETDLRRGLEIVRSQLI